MLKQDPSNPAIVYAGTTEGLWKTTDAGKTWKRVTNPEVVVNDVMVDPRNSQRVLLATDRAGVLASDDGAQSFIASNHGYTHRYVTAILADKKDPDTMYVGVVNDRELGGVFASHDAGQHWMQKSAGLDGRDVFTLKQSRNGETRRGHQSRHVHAGPQCHHLEPDQQRDQRDKPRSQEGRKTKTEVRSVLTARVNEIEITPKRWLAATSAGLFTSSNQGKSWSGGPVMGKQDFVSVQADGEPDRPRHSQQRPGFEGRWQDLAGLNLSSYVSSIRGVTVTSDGQIMFASREGAFRSPNAGAGWEHMQNGLPDKNISSISYDAGQQAPAGYQHGNRRGL